MGFSLKSWPRSSAAAGIVAAHEANGSRLITFAPLANTSQTNSARSGSTTGRSDESTNRLIGAIES